MTMPSDRRSFLRAAGAAAISAGAAASGALAIDPVSRIDGAKFKFSLAAYSYRNLLSGKDPQLTLGDFIDDCARFGCDGTELTSYYFPSKVTTAFLHDLQRRAFRNGVDVSGTAVGNDFGHADREARAKQVAHVKKWVDHAAVLTAPVIRIFAGQVKQGADPEQSHRWMVEAMEECCQYAGEHGVHLALENHGGPTATAEGLLRFVKDVKSPWFGVNLDTGNFHGADVYGELAQAAPYALNVQVKVVIKPAGGKVEPTDYKRLAQILRTANYRGYVVLEYEEKGDPRQECREHLDKLREAFGTA